MKLFSSPFTTVLVATSSLLCTLSEASPITGNNVAALFTNWTYPPLIASRIDTSTTLKKRSDTVIQAASDQIAQFTKYAGIASTSYCITVIPLNHWNCIQCQKQVPDGKLITSFSTVISGTSCFVLTSEKDKTIYLVFRGTYSARQGITDSIFTMVDYTPVSGAKVHGGYYGSVKEAIPSYFSAVQKQLTKNPDYKVVVTGHSLGASQAVLAGLDLFQRDSRITKENLFIHTVGGPRVGNEAFAKYVGSTGISYYRSVHKHDQVPHTPPRSWGYIHAGVEVWDKDGSNIVICTSEIESELCSNTVPDLSLNVIDHVPYYGILEGLCI